MFLFSFRFRFNMDETEAANLLVSLGNSDSRSPSFSPSPATQGPLNLRGGPLQSPTGPAYRSSTSSFTPISPHTNPQGPPGFVRTPAKSWASVSASGPSSGGSAGSSSSSSSTSSEHQHASPISSRFPPSAATSLLQPQVQS